MGLAPVRPLPLACGISPGSTHHSLASRHRPPEHPSCRLAPCLLLCWPQLAPCVSWVSKGLTLHCCPWVTAFLPMAGPGPGHVGRAEGPMRPHTGRSCSPGSISCQHRTATASSGEARRLPRSELCHLGPRQRRTRGPCVCRLQTASPALCGKLTHGLLLPGRLCSLVSCRLVLPVAVLPLFSLPGQNVFSLKHQLLSCSLPSLRD